MGTSPALTQKMSKALAALHLTPPGSQSKGSGGHLTQKKQTVEKNIKRKEGNCPNPCFFTTVVSQTFFIIIIIMIIVYIFSIKSMPDFVLFLKKKKIKILF